MLVKARERQLVKYLRAAEQAETASPARIASPSALSGGGAGGIARAAYEEFLLNKLFFKNGGIYLKVFKDPNELHAAVGAAIESELFHLNEAGEASVGARGQKNLHP